MAVQNMGRSKAHARAAYDYVSDYQITMARDPPVLTRSAEPSVGSWREKALEAPGGSSCDNDTQAVNMLQVVRRARSNPSTEDQTPPRSLPLYNLYTRATSPDRIRPSCAITSRTSTSTLAAPMLRCTSSEPTSTATLLPGAPRLLMSVTLWWPERVRYVDDDSGCEYLSPASVNGKHG